ncbi:MAG: hypothetical protein AB7P03_23025 [Kofleriaceae bacterium]
MPLAVVLAAVPACSFFSVVQAPREPVVITPPRCTQTWTAPLIDSLITGALVATAAAGVAGDTGAPLLLIGTAFPVSAAIGYHATYRCRELQRSPMVGSLDAVSAPVVASTSSVPEDLPIARDDMPIVDHRPTVDDSADTKREDDVPSRVPPPTRPPMVNPIRLPDEVVTRALDAGRSAFLRCFARAQREDPTLSSVKVVLHIEVDRTGAILAVQTDAAAAKFGSCLSTVARGLKFAPPGRDAVVEAPLFF